MDSEISHASNDNRTQAVEDSPPGLFHDVPRWVWRVFVAAWATLFILFILFMATGGRAIFAIVVATFFLIMAFGIPAIMASLSNCERPECGPIIQTRTGPLSVRAAAIQILTIPIGAVIGLVAFIALAM